MAVRLCRRALGICLMLAGNAAALDLVRDGAPAAVLVAPDGGNASAVRAAEELVYYAEKISGARLSVVPPARAEAQTLPRLFLGVPPPGFDAAALPRNGAVARRVGGDLHIAGRDDPERDWLPMDAEAGTFFAVCRLLEREWGVRWLWPGETGEVFPKARTLALSPPDGEFSPPLPLANFRTRVPAEGWSSAENRNHFIHQQAVWLRRHGFNQNYALQHYPHGLEAEWKRFASLAKTPEFFNLLPDGRRASDPLYHGGAESLASMCVSNPAFHQAIVRDFIVNRDPGLPMINLNENDTNGKCVCDNCLAWDDSPLPAAARKAAAARRFAARDPDWDRELGDLSTRYGRFYRAVLDEADRVAPELQAEAAILAYANYSNPPGAGVDFGGRAYIRFCPPRMFPWSDAATDDYIARFKSWPAVGAKVIVRPNFTLDGHCFPIVYAHHLGRALAAFNRDAAFVGVDFDSLKGDFAAQGVNYYMIARMLSARGAADPDAVWREFADAFGPAAATAGEYLDFWRRHSDAAVYDETDGDAAGGAYSTFYQLAPELFPPAAMAEAAAILDRAAEAASGDDGAAAKVAFLRVGLDHAQLTLDAEMAYREFRRSGEAAPFAAALARLDAFRNDHERDGAVNPGALADRENRTWARAMVRLAARDMTPLPDVWRFVFDPEGKGAAAGFADPGFDDAGWDDIRVDAVWDRQPPHQAWSERTGRSEYMGDAWYRVPFTVPEFGRKRVKLLFGAVDDGCDVYVNGTKIDSRRFNAAVNPNSWREAFELDVTARVKPGGNQLTVMVNNAAGAGGIWKGAFLKLSDAPPDPKKNLVANPGFEDGEKGWSQQTQLGEIAYAIDGKGAFAGKRAARLAFKAADAQGGRYGNRHTAWGRYHQAIAGLTPGQSCRVSVHVNTSPDFDGWAMVWMIAADGSRMNLDWESTGGQWRQLSGDFTPGAENGTLYLNIAASRGTLWFDDIYVGRSPE